MTSVLSSPVNIRDVLSLTPVIPVLTLTDAAAAVPLAEALCAGGLRVLEVTTPAPDAFQVIEAIRRSVPAAVVGFGSLTRPTEFAMAQKAGAQFGASPGLTQELIAAARGVRFALLPGVMTPAELIAARIAGFDTVKLFPAAQCGGLDMIHALAEVFPEVSFYPSGGITATTARDYLALPSVACVGGAWLTPRDLLANRDWKAIEQLAREALQSYGRR